MPLTPYQGKSRSYGHFECKECNKKWTSANSWANFGQDCTDCLINVYPHKQYRLKRSKRKNRGKNHKTELCGKCKFLGRDCRTQS